MNVEALRETVEFIGLRPERLNMLFWAFSRNYFGDLPDCGTAACFAGWRTIQDFPGILQLPVTKRSEELCWPVHPQLHARKVFELTPEQAARLFILSEWPNLYQNS